MDLALVGLAQEAAFVAEVLLPVVDSDDVLVVDEDEEEDELEASELEPEPEPELDALGEDSPLAADLPDDTELRRLSVL